MKWFLSGISSKIKNTSCGCKLCVMNASDKGNTGSTGLSSETAN